MPVLQRKMRGINVEIIYRVSKINARRENIVPCKWSVPAVVVTMNHCSRPKLQRGTFVIATTTGNTRYTAWLDLCIPGMIDEIGERDKGDWRFANGNTRHQEINDVHTNRDGTWRRTADIQVRSPFFLKLVLLLSIPWSINVPTIVNFFSVSYFPRWKETT